MPSDSKRRGGKYMAKSTWTLLRASCYMYMYVFLHVHVLQDVLASYWLSWTYSRLGHFSKHDQAHVRHSMRLMGQCWLQPPNQPPPPPPLPCQGRDNPQTTIFAQRLAQEARLGQMKKLRKKSHLSNGPLHLDFCWCSRGGLYMYTVCSWILEEELEAWKSQASENQMC